MGDADAPRGTCTPRLTSLQLMLQDVGLSLFDPSSNLTRPPGAVGCCRLAGFIPHKYLDEKQRWQEPGSLECVPTAAAWKVLLP